MKRLFPFMLFCRVLLLFSQTQGQTQQAGNSGLFRFYEDNDFLNIRGNGTDRAYTNGVRLDLFYQLKRPSRLLIDHLMPKAGYNSIDTYGWSVMQMMVTPSNLTIRDYQSYDYPYSGVLFVTHSLSSYNKKGKFNFRTELVAGIRGPGSLAKQTQAWIHRLIHDETPMGWQNQCSTKVLLNVIFTAEKSVMAYQEIVEVIGGAQVSAGTMTNAMAIYPLIRIGKMNPYFNGFLSQFGSISKDPKYKKMQIYFIVKPRLTFVATNAVMYGTIQRSVQQSEKPGPTSSTRINHFLAEMDLGTVIATDNFSISYTQKPTTAYSKGLYSHSVGNISLHFIW